MKVYELIQALSKYGADQEVEIFISAMEFPVTVRVDQCLEAGCETKAISNFRRNAEISSQIAL